jgi:ribosomal protein S12 methylthiotransferase
VGCFGYSPVEGADANALPDWVPEELAEERRAEFMQVQAEVSGRRLARFVGRELQVLVDAVQDGVGQARSFADAPEIDGVVRIAAAAKLKPGQFAKVKILACAEHDLEAVLI